MKKLTQVSVVALLMFYSMITFLTLNSRQEPYFLKEVERSAQVLENETTLLSREVSLVKAQSSIEITPDVVKDLNATRDKLKLLQIQRETLDIEVRELQSQWQSTRNLTGIMVMIVVGFTIVVTYPMTQPEEDEVLS